MRHPPLDPNRPYLVLRESEADGRGGIVATTTIFLTASTCPIGCQMCDLHQNTLAIATPPGAITTQIDAALGEFVPGEAKTGDPGHWLKLYNSGNFFDSRSIPPQDYRDIASRCEGFSRLIVENHPRFGAERLRRFRDQISIPLEVAVGLETVQPRWLSRLEKQMSRDDFDAYARWLNMQRVDLRVFLILGVPKITIAESLRWARLSVRHAVASGARHISLIPARSGHGWSGLANELPNFSLDDLIEAQAAAIKDADGAAVITIDLWDLDRNDPGYESLQQMNLSQHVASP